MTDEELQKAIVSMLSGGFINANIIKALHARGYIHDITEKQASKRTWRVTDEGKKFAKLNF